MRPASTADRCPGVLALHEAADGPLARVRLPGGLLSRAQLLGLCELADEQGNGRLELTSRGNVQLRALRQADVAAERLTELGLVPSATHERVRNIVASPLSDLRERVVELDRGLCARPRLAQLSGRFLFGLDGGLGDILALAPDVVVETTEQALDDAERFLTDHPGQWRAQPRAVPTAPPEPVGLVTPDTAAVLAPLGRLTTTQARFFDRDVTITPWRSVVVRGVNSDYLDRAAVLGLGVDAGHWYGLSACTGQPGCASALADVQRDAATATRRQSREHWSGCERRCGHPPGPYRDVLATPDGYVL